jgi:hypothetical protein
MEAHRWAKSIIRELKLQFEVQLEKSFCQLHNTLRIVEEVSLVLIPPGGP